MSYCRNIYITFMHLATYITFKLQFYILSALAFPGNRTYDLGVASAMLYHLSYRETVINRVIINLILLTFLNSIRCNFPDVP